MSKRALLNMKILNPICAPGSPEEEQSRLPEFQGTLNEYTEIVIQFGYVVLFAAAFPLGPLFCVLNNIVEIKLDAHKILCTTARPIPRGADSIGAWCVKYNTHA